MQGDLPTVVSGSFDGTMKLWDIRVGTHSRPVFSSDLGRL
jgi:WD40 repeat protein